MYGGAGDDFIDGGNEDDILYGGAGADTFRFDRHEENDVIKDFENQTDQIEFRGFGALFASWGNADVGARSYATQVGDHVVFDFGYGDTLTVKNATINQLSNDITYIDGGTEQLGSSGAETLSGDAGVDVIYGEEGADRLIGDDGNDFLYGGDGDDRLYAGAGNDYLVGGAGDDYLADSSQGVDYFYGGSGTDEVSYYGYTARPDSDITGVRANLLTGQNSDGDLYVSIEDLRGSEVNDDDLTGSNGANKLLGRGGNDRLSGEDGNDRLYGGDGADRLYGNNDADTLYGGNGADFIDGGHEDDVLYGGAGADTFRFDRHEENDVIKDFENQTDQIEFRGFGALFASWGNADVGARSYATQVGDHVVFDFGYGDTLTVKNATINQLSNDITYIDGGTEQLGSSGAETLSGDAGVDVIYGEEGADRLEAGDGDDFLYGGDGDDRLYGHGGDDYLVGGAGDDYLADSSHGVDYFYGGAGTDEISYYGYTASPDSDITGVRVNLLTGENSDGDHYVSIEDLRGSEVKDDDLTGSDGANKLLGRGGDDKLSGENGDDRLYGGDGSDRLYGNNDEDRLYGGAGDDFIDGGHEDDVLYGGAGADTFRFDRHEENDVIKDFQNETDQIEFRGFGALFDSWTELQAFVADDGETSGNVEFDFGGNDSLTIEGITLGDLQNDITFL